MTTTTDPKDPRLTRGIDTVPVPQNEAYLVLTPEEIAKGYVRPVREKYRHTKCGSETRMPYQCALTYAREPGFYGSTYCCSCSMHLPVSEFVWLDDNTTVGS